jgi:hypothetical protein
MLVAGNLEQEGRVRCLRDGKDNGSPVSGKSPCRSIAPEQEGSGDRSGTLVPGDEKGGECRREPEQSEHEMNEPIAPARLPDRAGCCPRDGGDSSIRLEWAKNRRLPQLLLLSSSE